MDDPTHSYGPTALPRLTGREYKRLLKGKGPTPGQKLRRQKLRRVTADDMPPRASDLPVVGDVEITAMPVPPLVHRNMPIAPCATSRAPVGRFWAATLNWPGA